MGMKCEVCGKTPAFGKTTETRGKAKYLGGVGTKLTGITRRKFKPNLQRVRITSPDGENKRVRVCTQCMKSGAIVKAIRTKPFQLPKVDEVKL